MKKEYGMFCKIYGCSIRNLIIENLLEGDQLDFAIGDLAEEVTISRPKAYQIIKELEAKKYVKRSRIVAGTQLYLLNNKNKEVKLLLNAFRGCLKLVIGKYKETAEYQTEKGTSAAVALL